MSRRARGHVMAEVLISGVVLAWALSGLYSGVLAASSELSRSIAEQQAVALARQKIEQLHSLPSNGWAARAGTTVAEADAGGHTGWTRSTVYSGVLTAAFASGPVAPVSWYEAVVTVTTAQGKTSVAQGVKWKFQ